MLDPPVSDRGSSVREGTQTYIIPFPPTAYEVLSDEDKRKEYDMIGHAGYTQKQNGGSGGGQGSYNQAFHFNFDDLFADFDNFGGGGFNRGFSSDFVSELLVLICMLCICE